MEQIENELVEHLYQKADKNHTPLGGVFELSPLCNMDCRMCYVRKTAEEVRSGGGLRSLEEWIHLAEEAKSCGTLFLLLTGGEPFLWPDFKKLYEKLHQMGFVLSINSNGTMINAEWVSWLTTMPPSRINITLYGSSDETYEKLCRNPKGFTQVTKAIELLKKAGITVKLSASVTDYNKDDIEGIIGFSKRQQLVLEVATYMFPPLRRDKTKIGKNDRMTPEDTVAAMKKVTCQQFGQNYLEQEYRMRLLQKEELEKWLKYEQATEGNSIQCRAGSSSWWISWNGKMLPCGMMVEPAASPFEDGFSTAWKQTVESVERIQLPLECRNCSKQELCHTCAAMIYSETGAFDRRPEYRCKMADIWLAHME